jgi:transforming growth factor-beta-induced protein
LVDTIVDLKNATIFAPTDDAFAALLTSLGAASLDDLSVEQLTPILTYHIYNGGVVDGAAAIEAGAVEGGTDLVGLGGTFNVTSTAAPTVSIDEASVNVTTPGVTYDIEVCQGIIHSIDAVLLPSVADIVSTSANYSNLLAAVTATGDTTSKAIVDALDDEESDLTLFAPTNDALAPVLDNAPANLATVLQYHVYPGGAVTSTAALAFTSASPAITMLAGGDVSIDGSTGDVVITDATAATVKAVAPLDIKASNGTIHSIDGVLLTEAD